MWTRRGRGRAEARAWDWPIAKHIMLAHGGMITAESELNHGCTFVFSIPEARANQTDGFVTEFTRFSHSAHTIEKKRL